MPTIRVELLSGRSREQKREFAQAVSHEGARILRCAPADFQVLFTDVQPADWINGSQLAGPAGAPREEP